MELFRKSGLSIDVLKQIWLLADKDTDGSLTSKEFCVAWHLIVCVSKKGLPLPKYLPDSLGAFFSLAPEVPPLPPAAVESSPAPEDSPTPVAASTQRYQPPVASSSSGSSSRAHRTNIKKHLH